MKRSLSKVLTSVVSASIVITMTVGLAGCKKSSNTSNSTSKNKVDKIDVFSMTANFAGMQKGWFGKLVKDKFGLEMNIIASQLQGGDSKYATMMAAHNLGDIVIFGDDGQKYTDAIKAGLVLDWTKDGLMDKYGKDIKNYPKAIQKAKTNFGKGSSVYGLGYAAANEPVTKPSEGADMTFGPIIRYDLYKKIGSPKITSLDNLLDVLKKMQKICPKSESGKKTYAFSLWADWDGNMMNAAKNIANMSGWDELGFLLVNATENKYQDILSKDGQYVNGLKFLNKANQMGLVDPDSISQKYDDAMGKMKDGATLAAELPFTVGEYNTQDRKNAGKGMKFVPFAGEKIYSTGFASYGGNRVISIGSKTKVADKIMKFINWMYTPEGIEEANYGPKGLAWDIKDGKPYVTDFGMKALPSNEVAVPQKFGGSTFKTGMNQLAFNNVVVTSTNPETKQPYEYDLWPSYLKASATKIDKEWQSDMGALTQKDYVVKNNMIATAPALMTSTDTPDSATTQKLNQINAIVKQYSWKMVFAKNDSQFNSLLSELTKKANGLGYKDVVKFYEGQAEKQFKERDSIK
ncbi:hypothetical protein [Clostridium oryzae]|uniref:Lipoprotein LipO n=1 Tax=Clostridium oryzae TaxID=1450648 RepID=A0A1V4IEN8_9CLOT|nr:hypothetical protein [Clostridium oryzae]OPJ58396.1 hypothetical protein CLORY_36260 [Clostridium oryzae]